MQDDIYEVETILKAKAFRSGKKLVWKYLIKWKGYDDTENTLEPEACLRGGADELLTNFWERVSLDGRDRFDLNQFRHGTELVPMGPPRRLKRTSIRTAEATAELDDEVQPSSSTGRKKRERELQPVDSTPPPKRPRKTTSRTAPKKSGTHLLDAEKDIAPPQSPSVPDSEDELLRSADSGAYEPRAADELPQDDFARKTSPPTRHTSKPSVKRIDEPAFPMALNSAVSAKSHPLPASKGKANAESFKRHKPGPGRSSDPLKNPPLIGAENDNGEKRIQPEGPVLSPGESVEEVLEVASHLQAEGAPIDSTIFSSQDENGFGAFSIEIPVAPPTAQALPELAGAKQNNAVELSDLDEGAAALQISDNKATAALKPNAGPTVMFLPSAPIGSTNPGPSASSSRWSWSGTIFGIGHSARLDDAFIPNEANHLKTASDELFLPISPNLSIPFALSDRQPAPSLADSSLETLVHAVIPGKLYNNDTAVKLLDTLETGGATARVLIDHRANSSEQAAFGHLCRRLEAGALFVVVFGSETLILCSSQNETLVSKLAISASLLDFKEAPLASHVRIRDGTAYAEVAAEGETIHW